MLGKTKANTDKAFITDKFPKMMKELNSYKSDINTNKSELNLLNSFDEQRKKVYTDP